MSRRERRQQAAFEKSREKKSKNTKWAGLKKAGVIIPIFLLIGVFLLPFYLTNLPAERTQVEGTVISIQNSSDERGNKLYLVCKLDNGNVAKVRAHGNNILPIGTRVLLNQTQRGDWFNTYSLNKKIERKDSILPEH